MHFANYVGDVPNKLRTVHDKLVVHVHQSRNFRRISLEEERIAGMLLWAAEPTGWVDHFQCLGHSWAGFHRHYRHHRHCRLDPKDGTSSQSMTVVTLMTMNASPFRLREEAPLGREWPIRHPLDPYSPTFGLSPKCDVNADRAKSWSNPT